MPFFHYNLVSFASFLLSSAFLLPEKEALNKDSWKLEYPTYLNQTFIGTNSALALRFWFPINPLFALLVNYHLSISFEAIQSCILGSEVKVKTTYSNLSTCIITAKRRAAYSLMNSAQCFPKLMSTTRSYFSTWFAVEQSLLAMRVISNMVTGGDSMKWGWRSEMHRTGSISLCWSRGRIEVMWRADMDIKNRSLHWWEELGN